eukprot:CAMPEP_0203749678 /NCGR_PEP_ID=MMETSP0098-20131031/4144_1 /ASSEMBLY_ACC=CAM_ASM_000208 /TAXON_ID=96639 /ORGANISM=" , Strain NY0313808BC1" /LENGTH=528 /DNA_ID=CAMNT_0050638771 /DNA_START=411 /DNA_END=1997 /DNA_ORIENTATION=+
MNSDLESGSMDAEKVHVASRPDSNTNRDKLEDLIHKNTLELRQLTLPQVKLQILHRSSFKWFLLIYVVVCIYVGCVLGVAKSLDFNQSIHDAYAYMFMYGFTGTVYRVVFTFLLFSYVPRIIIRRCQGGSVHWHQYCLIAFILVMTIAPDLGIYSVFNFWGSFSKGAALGDEQKNSWVFQVSRVAPYALELRAFREKGYYGNIGISIAFCMFFFFWVSWIRYCRFSASLVTEKSQGLERVHEENKRRQDGMCESPSGYSGDTSGSGSILEGSANPPTFWSRLIPCPAIHPCVSWGFTIYLIIYFVTYAATSIAFEFSQSMVPVLGLVSIARVCSAEPNVSSSSWCNMEGEMGDKVRGRIYSICVVSFLQLGLFIWVIWETIKAKGATRRAQSFRNQTTCMDLKFIQASTTLFWLAVYAVTLTDMFTVRTSVAWVQKVTLRDPDMSPSEVSIFDFKRTTDPLFTVGVSISMYSFQCMFLLMSVWLTVVAYALLPVDSIGIKGWWVGTRAVDPPQEEDAHTAPVASVSIE